MAAPRRAPHLRGDRARRPAAASSASGSTASASPAASRPCGPTSRCWSRSWPALGVDLALTTNGATLRPARRTTSRAAGLRRINISLDSLRRDRFAELTRRDELAAVLDGIDAAARGRASTRSSSTCVLMRGVNDDEVVDFAALRPRAGRRGPLHRVHAARRRRAPGRRDQVVPADEIVERHRRRVPARAGARGARARPSAFRYLDGGGEIGVIASVTQPFCGDVRPGPPHRRGPVPQLPVRPRRDRPAGAAARRAPATTTWPRPSPPTWRGKWAGHSIGQVTFIRPPRSMSQIGG